MIDLYILRKYREHYLCYKLERADGQEYNRTARYRPKAGELFWRIVGAGSLHVLQQAYPNARFIDISPDKDLNYLRYEEGDI